MRDLPFSLNKRQKIRMERALELLESLSSITSSDACITVSDVIPYAVSKGHGVREMDGHIFATRCGVVERVNKLVHVRSLRGRYKPEENDIIVGRVIEVAQDRWGLDINSGQDGSLMLSSMRMPCIKRRQSAVNELKMRSFFEENDVVCAEVRESQHDGRVQLLAKGQKNGKLEKGQLLEVYPYLVKKQRHHIHHLEQYGVDLILGRNGFIWVGEHVDAEVDATEGQFLNATKSSPHAINVEGDEDEADATPRHIRAHICRIANAIRVFSNLGFSIAKERLLETVGLSESLNIHVADMLDAEFHVLVVEKEAERRRSQVMMANT